MVIEIEKEIKCFSIFSGVGGFELGMKQAWKEKIKVVGFSEIDKYACQVLKYRFPEIKNYGDATEINPSELPEFDMLCGGFPCQAFSLAGKRLGFADTRGTLFYEIMRIAVAKRIPYLFLENVKGLLSHSKGRTFAHILSALDECGYDVQWEVLNSKNFGVPQNRERVFIIANLRSIARPQIFPLGIRNQESDSASEKARSERTRIYDYVANAISQRDYKGGNQLIQIGQVGEKDNMGQRIYDTKGIATSIRSQGGGQGAKTGLYETEMKIRRLTPTECERLQGFPDGWTKYGLNMDGIQTEISDTQRYRMMGNAVTVNVIQAIGERIKESIRF